MYLTNVFILLNKAILKKLCVCCQPTHSFESGSVGSSVGYQTGELLSIIGKPKPIDYR